MESRKRGWREVSFGEKGERRSARSPPYPARSLPRACRRWQTEGEDGLALTPVSSTGQALALSQDGRGDGRREGRIHRGGRRERRGRGGIDPHPRIKHGRRALALSQDGALTPVSSTGQALALSQDGRGDGRRWRRRAGNVASRCILLHFRLLLSSCEALE